MDREALDRLPRIVCPGCSKIVAQMALVEGTRAAILCRRCKQRVVIVVEGGWSRFLLEGDLVRRHNDL